MSMKNSIQGDLAMLVYNSFKGYLEKFVKEKFYKNGIDLAVIP
ncbi:18792_t:CDS:1, partial [Funneliformis geosporum]